MSAAMARDSTAARAAGAASLARLDAAWAAAVADAWRALWSSRLVVWACGALAVALWGISSRADVFDPASLTRPFGPGGDALAASLGRWDSVWYLAIAHDGYPGAGGARTAFFPLYPMLVRAAGAVATPPLVAGALVSTACFAVALVLLHRLCALELGRPAARATVVAVAFFPASLFFSAAYAESLYLALSVGCVLAARTGRWGWAGALGALAAATRSAGLVLAVPLVALWWSARPRRAGDLACIALVPAGAAAFCGWLALRGGHALAPFEAQGLWYRRFAGPFVGGWDGLVAAWAGARQLLSGSREHVFFGHAGGDPIVVARANLLLAGSLVLAVPALIGTFRRLAPAYGAYALVALALPLSWPVAPQPLMSLPRFEAVLFPLFMWLGAWSADGGPVRRRLLVGCGALGLAGCSALFATWRWVA
jgi:Mannosyltransferase (PIG-V)